MSSAHCVGVIPVALRWFSTFLFLAILAAGAFGPQSLTLCPAAGTVDDGNGELIAAALAPHAPRLAFALTTGVLLADPDTLTGTSFWPMDGVEALAWTPDGSLLMASDAQGGLYAIDAAQDRIRWARPLGRYTPGRWLFKPDLGLGALAPDGGGLLVFRLQDGLSVEDPGLTSTAFWADHR